MRKGSPLKDIKRTEMRLRRQYVRGQRQRRPRDIGPSGGSDAYRRASNPGEHARQKGLALYTKHQGNEARKRQRRRKRKGIYHNPPGGDAPRST